MFCNKCGTVVPDDSSFCHKCGYKFVIPLVQTPTPTQTTTPQPVIYPPAAPQGAPQQPIAPAPVPQPAAVPQPQVTPQRVQYAPQPAPQPQVITPPQTIPQPTPVQLQYQQPVAPQPQVTPAPQPVAPQAQYQQPVYQPQMAYPPKKAFDAKKSAAIVAISVPVAALLSKIIADLLQSIFSELRYNFFTLSLDSGNYIAYNILGTLESIFTNIISLIIFFFGYYIFSKGNRNKAPRFIWIVFYSAYNAFCNLLYSTLYQIFYVPHIPDKYDPYIYEKLNSISTTNTLVSNLFACIMSYIIAAIILYQLYSRFDSSGRIIHNRLLLKNQLPLDKKGATLCALCVPIAMLINAIIAVIINKIPLDFPTGLSPVFFFSLYAVVPIALSIVFISNKKFSGFPQTLPILVYALTGRFYSSSMIGYHIACIVYNVAFLSDAQLETSNVLYYVFDFPIELLCAFALMYSILKDLTAPAHKFPPELIVQKAPAITE
jgi:hypothetical protein